MSDTLTLKIGKLVNQAENAGTEAEAAVFMAKAQKLATQYSIDLARARHATIAKEKTTPITRTVTLGERRTRGLNTYVELIDGIARANGLKVLVFADSTRVQLLGYEEDIDVTEALYASLLTQMVHACEVYKKTGDWKQDTVTKTKRTWDSYWAEWDYVDVEVPVSWLSARLDFQNAYARRVRTRLWQAKVEAEMAAVAVDTLGVDDITTVEQDAATIGTELVLREKSKEVEAYFRTVHKGRGTWRGCRDNVASNAAYNAGREAANSAKISRNAEIGRRGAISA
jgi:hypothetical protein